MAASTFDFDKMYCAAIKRGDILLYHEGTMQEVIVVVQENILNERLSTVLGVPLETHKEGATVYRNELVLKANETNLGKSAVCRPHKMKPYDRRHITAKKGEVTHERLRDLLHTIDINLGRFRDK